MKTAKHTCDGSPSSRFEYGSTFAFRSSKIGNRHLERLAIVYVRQSSPRQVMEHRESRERQYALVEMAKALGWPAERILVIDEDQGQSGKSADNRLGFQKVLAEVAMEHGGMVLGLEMSRLARSSKDWHHLFELCGVFHTLLADEDGVYDANDPTDRMVLGLKGIMSELELQTMHNRLQRGVMNKARRGELFYSVPVGYIILPNDQVALDPDAEVRSVVQLLFDKFDELGSIFRTYYWFIQQNVSLPKRLRSGPRKGELEWRRATMNRVRYILRHPIYAGAYAYGRHTYPRTSPYPSTHRSSGRTEKPLEEWKVLIKDCLPAYITWDKFLKNRERIQQNRQRNGSLGVPRNGGALLTSVLVCGACNCTMNIKYLRDGIAYYACESYLNRGTKKMCPGLTPTEVEELVTNQVLKAIEPAALELSMSVLNDLEREQVRQAKQWEQRMQRARYEIDLAQRRYRAVDPGNRLVAAALEQQWEEAMRNELQIQDEYDRFLRDAPTQLTSEERSRILALSSDIPSLWRAAGTTNADRKAIIRCLIDRVVVHVHRDSQYVDATIHWNGGFTSQHEFVRAVHSYSQLRDLESLMAKLLDLRQQGKTIPEIAIALNAEGFLPPRRHEGFTPTIVRRLLRRGGLMGKERLHDELLGPHEWWLVDLAKRLNLPYLERLRGWAKRGWVHGRQTPIQKSWILWADDDEIVRLQQLAAYGRQGHTSHELTTPKPRP